MNDDEHPGHWNGGTPTEMDVIRKAPPLSHATSMPREPRPPPSPQTPLTLTLTLEQWNAVLAVMNEAPLPNRIVAPLLVAISAQLQRAGG